MIRGAVVIFALVIASIWLLSSSSSVYSVVIDAGSTGSRVHVYEFKLVGGEPVLSDELFIQLKPGLSSFAGDPQRGAESLLPLVRSSLKRIPAASLPSTRVMLGATAGLRMLPGSQADDLLAASRDLLNRYNFAPIAVRDVGIMSGTDEGKFAWLAVNKLTSKLGAPPAKTVGVIDLGGGSVQMMRALSPAEAATAPGGYVYPTTYRSRAYQLYVHSFLGYGLKAGRLAVLKQTRAASACMPAGKTGDYTYNKETVDAAGTTGSDFNQCTSMARQALNLDKPCELSSGCAFDGSWGGGSSSTRFYLLSYLYERIDQAGAGDFEPNGGIGSSSIEEVAAAATRVCSLPLAGLKASTEFSPEDPEFFCLDLSFIYTLLKDGFGIRGGFNLAKKFDQGGVEYEAAWALGAALERL